MHRRNAAAALVAALVLGALAPARADLSSAAFVALRKGVHATAKKKGKTARKLELFHKLRSEKSARGAELLVYWIATSHKLTAKLERDHEAKQKKADRLLGATSKKAFEARRALAGARGRLQAEVRLQASLTSLVPTFHRADAVKVLLDESRPDIKVAWRVPAFRESVFELCKRRPAREVTARLCAFALDESMPEARLWVLRWIANGGVKEGFDAAVHCLGPGPALIRRDAVATLLALDDPRCVPALIASLKHADGLVAEEVERALHAFTGKTFKGYGSGDMWARWWAAEGAAWLAGDTTRRYEAKEKRDQRGAAFYGIKTRSTRIVFVLDRSGSMKKEIVRGTPTSGSKRDDSVPGGTRIEIAKNQLARTIRSLKPDVRFGVVFYGSRIMEWRPTQGLKPATPGNKKEAIAWFMPLKANGPTPLFAALDRGLRYARAIQKRGVKADGADTIFLLSDGHPTNPRGPDDLTADQREVLVLAFLAAARPFRCVVHTIGIGPGHSKKLMKRIAEATDGEYRAVGMR